MGLLLSSKTVGSIHSSLSGLVESWCLFSLCLPSWGHQLLGGFVLYQLLWRSAQEYLVSSSFLERHCFQISQQTFLCGSTLWVRQKAEYYRYSEEISRRSSSHSYHHIRWVPCVGWEPPPWLSCVDKSGQTSPRESHLRGFFPPNDLGHDQ